MSKVWDAIKLVERERELAGRGRSPAERATSDRPITAYLAGVRRRSQERAHPEPPAESARPIRRI
jgi:hypothetical protein